MYFKGRAQLGCLMYGPYVTFDKPGAIFGRIELAAKNVPNRYRVCTKRDITNKCIAWKC